MKCPECKGQGWQMAILTKGKKDTKCYKCDGTGEIDDESK